MIFPIRSPKPAANRWWALPGTSSHETIRDLKRQLVLKAMDQSKKNYTEAARLLGLHPNNLHRLMKNLNLKAAKLLP
jgi:transcriptional regulator with GAF, ATPase, and Fis domain